MLQRFYVSGPWRLRECVAPRVSSGKLRHASGCGQRRSRLLGLVPSLVTPSRDIIDIVL